MNELGDCQLGTSTNDKLSGLLYDKLCIAKTLIP